MPYQITRADAERDLKALRYLLEVGMVRHSSVVEVIAELADSIEEQVKPAVPDAYDRESWRNGYKLGTQNTRERIYNRQTALKARLITATEHNAIDLALAEIEADVEDTVTGRGCPS